MKKNIIIILRCLLIAVIVMVTVIFIVNKHTHTVYGTYGVDKVVYQRIKTIEPEEEEKVLADAKCIIEKDLFRLEFNEGYYYEVKNPEYHSEKVENIKDYIIDSQGGTCPNLNYPDQPAVVYTIFDSEGKVFAFNIIDFNDEIWIARGTPHQKGIKLYMDIFQLK